VAKGLPTINQLTAQREAEDQERKDIEWIQRGQAKLSEILRDEKEAKETAQVAVMFLAEYLNSQVGIIHVVEGDSRDLLLTASYGFKNTQGLPQKIGFGEGLAGQVALKKELLLVKTVPQDYILVSSALGEAPPRAIVVAPLISGRQVVGVAELGSFEAYTQLQLDFLDSVKESIGISLQVAHSRSLEKVLLAETQERAEELRMSEEELRQSNEEMEEQTRSLRDVEANLQNQKEELQQVNEELKQEG